jgi:surface protein
MYVRTTDAYGVRPSECMRARVCAWARPHPRQRLPALHAAVDFRVVGSQAFASASVFNANIGAWNTARVTDLSSVCAAFRPARTAADCARPVFDVARPLFAAALPMCVSERACGCACSYPYKGVWRQIADIHTCAIHVKRTHAYRPFTQCRYTDIHIDVYIVRGRACGCARVGVCVRRRAACVQTTKICRSSGDSVLHLCIDRIISLGMCGTPVYTPTTAHCARACVLVVRMCTSLAAHVSDIIHIYKFRHIYTTCVLCMHQGVCRCLTHARACVRARVCAWARPHPRQRVRALHAAAERRVLGSQAFQSASAFNANISTWNTASVTGLSFVCAASGPARTAADCARPVVDACAAVVRRGAADVSARARVRVRM